MKRLVITAVVLAGLLGFASSSAYAASGHRGWGGHHHGGFHAVFWGPGVWVPRPHPSARHAYLDLDVNPDEAEVYLDGEYVGEADDYDGRPGYLEVTPGRHDLEFHLPGHRTLKMTVRAVRGRVIEIDRRLELQR